VTARGGAGLRVALALVVVAVAGCALVPADREPADAAADNAFAPTPTGLRAQPLADGVWVLRGSGGEAAPRNRGWIANIGVIAGPNGVVLIDTGSSRNQIEAALAAVAQLTPLPVVMAVVTHQGPEAVFGAAALRARGIPLVAHERAANLIEQRCAICLARLRETLGANEMRGSDVTVPDRRIDGDATISVGGRAIDLIDVSQSRGSGDIVVLDRASGVLFASGLASAGRLPELHDGDIAGWLAALARLDTLVRELEPAAIVVPGFGAPGGAEVLADTRGYLTGLDAAVHAAQALDIGLVTAMDSLKVTGYERWAGQTSIGPQNVQKRWLAIEKSERP